MGHIINPDFLYEDLGTELLVCDPDASTVVRLNGVDADALRCVLTNSKVSAVHRAVLDRLAGTGIVLAEGSESAITRRRLLQLSAAGAATAGLSVVALPNAAAALSPEPGPDPGGPIPDVSRLSNPAAFNVSADRSGAEVVVNWATGFGDVFTYRWTVYDQANIILATDTTTSGQFVPTGVVSPPPVTVRFFAGNVIGEVTDV